MRTSSNESNSDDDEYLSKNENIKTFQNNQNNFENIKKTAQLNRKDTTTTCNLISRSLIPCKRKFNIYNNNDNNKNGYISTEENNLENLININKSTNENINNNNDTIKRGKFFKSGCTLNVIDDNIIPLKYKSLTKKSLTLFGKQKHRTIKLNKYNKCTQNNFKEYNKNSSFDQKDHINENNLELKENSNTIKNIPQNQSSKLSLNFVENRKYIKYPLLPSSENNFAGQNFNLKRKSEENISSINIITNPTKHIDYNKTLGLLGDAVPLIKKPKNFINFKDMSVYDRRYQTDDRPPNPNGILSRVASSQHQQNDENSTSITNQYYSSSTMAAATNGNNGGINVIQQQPPTIATLCNIGNTCYLNSVVYTLRFAPLFLHNLHHLIDDLSSVHRNIGKYRAKSSSLGRNVTGLHMENARSWSSKDLASLEGNNGGGGGNNGSNNCSGNSITNKSSQQIATEKLHELYQNLHRNEILDSTEPFHADTFLHAIQDVSAIFEGNQQQDAHEFLMCVLDNIRETCQSLIKSISECPDVISNGYVSLPEQIETNVSKTGTSKDQISQTNSNSSNNISSAASQATSLIKSSFFSRKSKRKDDTKISKNFRLQFPHKDNTQSSSTGFNVTTTASDINNVNTKSHSGINNSAKTSNNMITEKDDKDLTIKDKAQRLADKIKKLGLDFFTEDFEGITVSTTKCLSCETITEQKETMIDIAVPISGFENTDFTEKSHSFIQNSCITREYFRGENKYRCEQCIGYTEAIRSISYEVLPRLLVIQLSRFSGGMEKINSYLPTPFTLQCFCSKCCNKSNDEEKLHIYKLYSVITHVGATMSVGHYIAYTCSLDWSNEYINCPKERQRQQHQNQINLSKSTLIGTSTNTSNVVSNGSNSSSNNGTEKNVGLMKKMFSSRSKASSSGDMSKTVKNVNTVVGNKDITTNCIDKQQQQKIKNNNIDNNSIICQSVNCCGTKLKTTITPKTTNSNISNITANYNNNHGINGSYVDLADDSAATNTNQNSNLTGGYNAAFNNIGSSIYSGNNSGGSNLSGGNRNVRFQAQSNDEPIWYMCDDDKIKAMTQREFEELLSPNRKIMITPYLLFYARKNYHNGNVKDGQEDGNSDVIDVSGAADE